jgi:hypothetical protein
MKSGQELAHDDRADSGSGHPLLVTGFEVSDGRR